MQLSILKIQVYMKPPSRPLLKKLLILLAAAIAVKVFSFFSGMVEKLYSTGAYRFISACLRYITGWLPFSLGDILYALVIIWLVYKLVKCIGLLVKRRATWAGFWQGLGKAAVRLLWVYVIFNVLWGFNYDRLGISYQLQLKPGRYKTEDIKQLTDDLLLQVNTSRLALGDSTYVYPSYQQVFSEAVKAYDSLAVTYPFLHYRGQSIKSSVYSTVLSSFGFLGYYNPFSGEAQVNTAVPQFTTPYTTCHEIAHQLGYGSEDEANFVGYLSAVSSKQAYFHYSAYLDLFSYANGALYMRDSMAARANYRALDTLVKRDLRLYREFIKAHKNPAEPVIKLFYGEYLKANKQPKGIDTYDEVVAWLLAYRKKYGHI